MLKKFLDLGQQPLANSYLRKSQLKKKEKKLKLELLFDDKSYLVSIKNNLLETEKTLLRDLYNKQKQQFENNLRNKRFESIRYAIYSCIFIAFYFMLMLFFNRLHKSS